MSLAFQPGPELWSLDPSWCYLNHGSFGARLRSVAEAQSSLRARIEAQPVRFFLRELEGLLDEARAALAQVVGAGDPGSIAPMPNATAGVSTVLRSLELAPGDELVTTDHAYGACKNALEFVAARSGARVRVARVPFPIAGPEQVVRAITAELSPRTKLALVDHVTSPTGLVFPVEAIARALAAYGVPLLIDGAHAPGMVPVDLDALARAGAQFYVANLHKWLCAPLGCAFLFVRGDWRERVRPLAISHGAAATRVGRSKFLLEFDWTGTSDPTPFLALPTAIGHLAALHQDGLAGVARENHALVVAGRAVLCRALGVEPACPEAMLGSLASVELPAGLTASAPVDGDDVPPSLLSPVDPVQDFLHARKIEVPIFPFGGLGSSARLLRVSAQRYNTLADYEKLAAALGELAAPR